MINQIYIFQSIKNGKFYVVKDVVFNYSGFLSQEQITDIFDNIVDCSGLLFDLYNDPDDATIDDKVLWMKRNKYVELVEVDFDVLNKVV